MKTIIILMLFLSHLMYAKPCEYNSIQSQGDISLYDLIVQISSSCQLSLIIKDSASTQQLKNIHPFVRIDKLSLKESMDILLHENGLFYDLTPHALIVYLFKTHTFKMDYVGTYRNSVSSTEVSISRNDGDMGYKAKNGADIFEKSGGSRSGINITTEDGFDFWANIEREIQSLLHSPGDHEKTIHNQSPIINKGAGLITVTGNKGQLERIENYIKHLQGNLSKQVMIDLSILNVSYHQSKTMGIDWDQLYNLQNISHTPKEGSQKEESFISFTKNDQGRQTAFTINLFPQGLSLNRVVEFLEGYGNVHTLSNPKLLTIHNQPAMISVGDVIRYRKSTVFQSSHTNTTTTNTDTEYPSVFAGVLLDITPSIFNQHIMLKINPSITRLKGKTVQNAAQALDSPPNLNANQLSSIINAKHGERVIIGGLVSKSSDSIKQGIPWIKDIPILGYLFSYEEEREILNEMILVITPYIIDPDQATPSIPEHLSPHL